MEKRKLILVAVSVGVFLVIAISASILFFSPRPSSGAARTTAGINPGTIISAPRPIPAGTGAAGVDDGAKGIDGGAKGIDGGENLPPEPAVPARTQPASADVVDMVRNADGIPGLQPPPFSSITSQETNFYFNGVDAAPSGTGGISIDVRPRSAAGVPDAGTGTAAPAANRPAVSTAPAAAAPAAKPPAVAAKPPAAKPAAPKPTPSPARPNNDYWVQIGAFSAKVRAEGVKETLASRGITTIIDDRDVDGKTLYRVRVGPYTSESEAGYWLALVKEIEGFADSQIRTSVRR